MMARAQKLHRRFLRTGPRGITIVAWIGATEMRTRRDNRSRDAIIRERSDSHYSADDNFSPEYSRFCDTVITYVCRVSHFRRPCYLLMMHSPVNSNLFPAEMPREMLVVFRIINDNQG